MKHTVNTSPLTKFEDGLQSLQKAKYNKCMQHWMESAMTEALPIGLYEINKNLAIANRSRVSYINTNNNTMT